jgi:sec-independent protein translocase protein TatC
MACKVTDRNVVHLETQGPLLDTHTGTQQLWIQNRRKALLQQPLHIHGVLDGIELHVAIGTSDTQVINTKLHSIGEFLLCQVHGQLIVDPAHWSPTALQPPVPIDTLSPRDLHQLVEEGGGKGIINRDHLARPQQVAAIMGGYPKSVVGSSHHLSQRICADVIVKHLPPESSMIYTALPEAFFTYLKVSFLAAIFLASPYVLYQIWLFVAPALYSHEKKYIVPFVGFSTILFISGAVFAYFVVFPWGFKFFLGFSTETIQAAPKLKEYLSFCSVLLIAFGLIFELPLFILFLAKLGIVDAPMLSRNRRYVILGMFAMAAVFTPPDIVTQVMMAGPLIVLYEASIWIAKLISKKREEETDFD